MAAARDIADWIVRRRHDLGAATTNLELQKHLYYAQAFHLGLTGEPLFADSFQAWKYGPVLRAEYERFRSSQDRPIPKEMVGDRALTDDVARFLNDVEDVIGGVAGYALARMTHAESPWREARGSLGIDEPSNVHIDVGRMRDYYAGLLELGEDRLGAHGLLDAAAEPRWRLFYIAGVTASGLRRHPFYDWKLARLLTKAPAPRAWPDELFRPPAASERRSLDIGADATAEEIRRLFEADLAAS